jgi:hypothetical protein
LLCSSTSSRLGMPAGMAIFGSVIQASVVVFLVQRAAGGP